MSGDRLPPRAEELVKTFVGFHERVKYYLEAAEQEEFESSRYEVVEWVTELCSPAYDDVVAAFEDTTSVFTYPSFIHLLYRDNTYQNIRDRHIRLVDALKSQSPRQVLEELFKHLDKLTAEDRAQSFLLLASEMPSTSIDEDEDKVRSEWLNRIVESFQASPRGLRPQLLLAASIIGHERMVSLLLRDIAADDELAPNSDAVEAECLIEAARNQQYSIVKELLHGERFSTSNETCWDAVVQALEVSCTNGSADITDILLPHYLSYCSVIPAHHPRLLRLALSNGHFEIVGLLLGCDPRGALCNLMELIDTLREEVAQATREPAEAAAPSGLVAIIVGDDMAMWDAAALVRAVMSGNTSLVQFLVKYKGFSPEMLTAALQTARDNGNVEVVAIISTKLQQLMDSFEAVETEDEAVSEAGGDRIASQQLPPGVHLVDKRWTNGTSDSRLDPSVVVVSEVAPHATRPHSVESAQALRTASIKMVEHMISSAGQSAALKMAKSAGEQVPVEDKVGKDSEYGVEGDSLTEMQDPRDNCPTTTLALLRQFTYKTVDQIICQGKLAVTQQETEKWSATSAVLNPKRTTISDAAAIVVGDAETPPVESIHVEIYSVGYEELSAVDQNREEEADLTESDMVDEPGITSTTSATQLPTRCLQNEHTASLLDDVEALEVDCNQNEGVSATVNVPLADVPQTTATTEFSCSAQTPVPRPHTSTTSICSPSASPTRNTIPCPVKWVEHEISGRVVDPSVYEDGKEESCVPRDFIQLVESAPSVSRDKVQDGCGENREVLASDHQETADELYTAIENVPTTSRYSLTNDNPRIDNGQCANPAVAAEYNSTDFQVDREDCGDDHLNDECVETSTNGKVDAREHLVDALSEMVFGSCSPSDEENSAQSYREQTIRLRELDGLDMDHNWDEASQLIGVIGDNTQSDLNATNGVLATQRSHVETIIAIEHLPEIPSIIVPSAGLEQPSVSRNEHVDEIRLATGASQRKQRARGSSQQSRCRTTDNVTSEEMTEWKNVDLLLNRKRRLLQTQTGSVEVPWGEQFATIQSLKRFAAQHPEILRAHIETKLRELDGPLLSNSPVRQRSPRTRNALAHVGVSQARDSLLLMKDLAFLLKHRLSPFFDTIVPVMMETTFNAEKRFLCETAAEVLDAMVLHCSGRKLALLFLQLGETYSKYEDLRLYNLASLYVEKCIRNWNKPECASLHSSQSSTLLLTLLVKSLLAKSAPVRTSAQKSLRHLCDELGTCNFEAVVRAHVPSEHAAFVLKECGGISIGSPNPRGRQNSSRRRETKKEEDTRSPTIVPSSPSIMQRMLLQRQNRVLPTQT